ncbi:hypothetical protein J4558_22570 [Leptolyngbya sp. 15MV]|nr:hypothetical protein J4558_22570 [Leptolyngbya sp. 15MV]
MRSLFAIAAVAVPLALGAQRADAAPIVHDTVPEFSSISITQGPTGSGGLVDPTRSLIGNMFDGNLSSIFSLGLGGVASFVITPLTNSITSGSVIELTNRPHQKMLELVIRR